MGGLTKQTLVLHNSKCNKVNRRPRSIGAVITFDRCLLLLLVARIPAFCARQPITYIFMGYWMRLQLLWPVPSQYYSAIFIEEGREEEMQCNLVNGQPSSYSQSQCATSGWMAEKLNDLLWSSHRIACTMLCPV